MFILSLVSAFSLFAQDLSLDAQVLRDAWEKRDERKSEIQKFIATKPKTDNYDVMLSLTMMAYYSGSYLVDQKNKDLKMGTFEYGYQLADAMTQAQPNRVEGYYWYAVNFGQYGQTKGIMAALGGAEKMRTMLEKALKIDPKYSDCGADRVLGRMYFKLPGGFVSFGDNKKAHMHLKKALECGPNNILSYVFLADVQAKVENKEVARKTLEQGRAAVKNSTMGKLETEAALRDLEVSAKNL